ncbi:MAG TPA: UDP-2,3-diacylglucosamine diphosphatase LpxI [Xanthobacteraceae bacterium]|jgi:hypothetical protein
MRENDRNAAMGPLAIVCGGGAFPAAVADAVLRRGREVFLFALRGFADEAAVRRYPHQWIYLGAIGGLIRAMKRQGCRDLVFVGAVHRPRLRDIRLDWTTIRWLPAYLRVARQGDNQLLSNVGRLFEHLGMRVRGVHEVAPELIVPAGVLGRGRPSAAEEAEIALGRSAIQALGPLDVGQAAVVVGGRVVAIEAAEGTAAMLARVAEVRRSGRVIAAPRAGVLVKGPKPGQDRRHDLPAIGLDTVKQAAAAGLAGIAVEAGGTIVADANALVRAADEAGLFLFAFEPDAGASR